MSSPIHSSPGRNLAMELVRATEAGALGALKHIGMGDKNAADGAAVEAMRNALNNMPLNGVVVIGEGEKDEAPMLANGEYVGNGDGVLMDIAVDPIDGTTLTSEGGPGAISVIAASNRGTMFDPGPIVYMDKVVIGSRASKSFDPEAPLGDQIKNVASSLGKDISEMMVAVLKRDRHSELVANIRSSGARVRLFGDGDVAMAIAAALPGTGVDMLMGVGGTPEGVIAAAALKCLGGSIFGKLYPRNEAELQAGIDFGFLMDAIITIDDLVAGDNCFFAATGITSGEFLDGVKHLDSSEGFTDEHHIRTSSVAYRSATGTVREIRSTHNLTKMEALGISL
jgi:fructose-1,6-bisphosphatase II